MENFCNFSKWKIDKFPNFIILKISKFTVFFPIWKIKIWLLKLSNFEIVRPFKIPHRSRFRRFSYLPFDVNQFRRLNFWILISYFSDSSIRIFYYIWTFVNFQIRNVWHSITEILTLTLQSFYQTFQDFLDS